MLKSKLKSWIAFSIGFSVVSPQIAFAADPGIDCAAVSHPSCPTPMAQPAPAKKTKRLDPLDQKIAGYKRELAQTKRKSDQLDIQIKKARAQSEKINKAYQPYLERKEAKERAKLLAKLENDVKVARAERDAAAKVLADQVALIEKMDAEAAASQDRENISQDPREAEFQARLAEVRDAAASEKAELDRQIAELRDLVLSGSETTAAPIDHVDAPPATAEVASIPVAPVEEPAAAPMASPEVSSKEIIVIERKAEAAAPVQQEAPKAKAEAKKRNRPTVVGSMIKFEVSQKRMPSGADISEKDIPIAFPGLTAFVDEKAGTVTPDFLIFRACEDVFKKNVEITQASRVHADLEVGIRARDPGNLFRACMASKQGATCNDGTPENACVRFSELKGDEGFDYYREHIVLPKKIDRPIQIGLFTAKPNQIEEELDFKRIKTYKTNTVVKAEQKQVDRAKVFKLRKEYSCIFTECFSEEGGEEEARKACNGLKNLALLEDLLDVKTRKEIANEYAICSGRIEEKDFAAIETAFNEEKDPRALQKKADQLVSIAKRNRSYANKIAEMILNRADAFEKMSDTVAALPGLDGTQNPAATAQRTLKATTERLDLARTLYKKGLALNAGKDWNAAFKGKMDALEFTQAKAQVQACAVSAQTLGSTGDGVSACLNQNLATATKLYNMYCTDPLSTQCTQATELYNGTLVSNQVAQKKTLALIQAQQQQQQQSLLAQQQAVMGNGNGFLGLSSLPSTVSISPSTGSINLSGANAGTMPPIPLPGQIR